MVAVLAGLEGDGNEGAHHGGLRFHPEPDRIAGDRALGFQPSQPLIVRWENGIPGTSATVSIFGTQDMR